MLLTRAISLGEGPICYFSNDQQQRERAKTLAMLIDLHIQTPQIIQGPPAHVTLLGNMTQMRRNSILTFLLSPYQAKEALLRSSATLIGQGSRDTTLILRQSAPNT
ncbi:hypothetical protein M3J09_007580 [Ascochyta lentis]